MQKFEISKFVAPRYRGADNFKLVKDAWSIVSWRLSTNTKTDRLRCECSEKDKISWTSSACRQTETLDGRPFQGAPETFRERLAYRAATAGRTMVVTCRIDRKRQMLLPAAPKQSPPPNSWVTINNRSILDPGATTTMTDSVSIQGSPAEAGFMAVVLVVMFFALFVGCKTPEIVVCMIRASFQTQKKSSDHLSVTSL